MVKYKIRNKIEVDTKHLSIANIMELVFEGLLVSIPEFLQRKLLKEKWFASEYKNSKEYNISIFKGQGKLDSITIVPIKLLIKKIESSIKSEVNSNVRESLKAGLNQLKDFESNGATLVNLDGQSRIILGIQEYAIENTFSLGKEASSIILDVTDEDDNTKESSDLVHKKFKELDKNLQNIYKNELLTTNIVKNFYDFDDIVDALVNKQRGFNWSTFQIAKQKARFYEFVVNLVDIFKTDNGKLFTDYWRNNMKNLKVDYKTDVNGEQFFSIIGGYLMEKGTYIKDDDAIKQLLSPDPIKRTSIEKFTKLTTTSFFNHLGKTKVGLPQLINFVVFKMVLENGIKKGSKPFTKDIRITKDVIILNHKKLVDAFIQLHLKLIAKKTPHPASWYRDDKNSPWLERKDGYVNLCTQQKDDYIIGRMNLFFQNLDWETLVSEKVIKLSDDNSKPSQDEVLVANDFKDILGKSISTSEFSNMDISHYISTDNNGSNELTNLGLEHFSSNRSRGSENIEKKDS